MPEVPRNPNRPITLDPLLPMPYDAKRATDSSGITHRVIANKNSQSSVRWSFGCENTQLYFRGEWGFHENDLPVTCFGCLAAR